jgi:hypothetical protein
MKKPESMDRLSAPGALGITGWTLFLPLRQALYAIAREQANEEVESADLGIWGDSCGMPTPRRTRFRKRR